MSSNLHIHGVSGAGESPSSQALLRVLISLVTGLLVLAGILALAWYFSPVVGLFGIVLIATYLLLGPVWLVERTIMRLSAQVHRIPGVGPFLQKTPPANPRFLAIAVALFVGLTLVSIATSTTFPLLTKDTRGFTRAVSGYTHQAIHIAVEHVDATVSVPLFQSVLGEDTTLHQLKLSHPGKAKNLTQAEKNALENALYKATLGQAGQWLTKGLSTLSENLVHLMTRTLNGFVLTLSGFLLTFYFLLDGHKAGPALCRLLPDSAEPHAVHLLERFHDVMFSFIKGQVLLGLLTGGYMLIVYHLWQVPYALFLGVFMAFAEFLPVVGTWIGLTPAILVMLFTVSPFTLLGVWVSSYCYQTIKDNVVAPKIVGGVMGLHPMVVILSLLICAQVAGLLGVLFALPLASAINVVLQYLSQRSQPDSMRTPLNAGGGHDALPAE
ncbi:MAG: AI-2E family transporter [Candidatus Melainabacteria bacterium]